MKSKIVIFLLLLAAIVAGVLFILPYLKEKSAFNRVESERTIKACEEYEADWPDGSHLDDVLFMRVNLSKDSTTFTTEMSNYLTRFAYGKHANEVNKMWDELWDREIAKYTSADNPALPSEAADMMTKMLTYMKEQRVNAIVTAFQSNLHVKEYTEYDEEVRSHLDQANENTLSFNDGIIPIKTGYDDRCIEQLNAVLTTGLQQSFNKVFIPGFIRLVPEADDSSLQKALPKLTVNYRITSLENKIYDTTYPDIWTYTSGKPSEGGEKEAKGYLIGVRIHLTQNLTMPDSTTTPSLEISGEPTTYFDHIKNVQHGYLEMTSELYKDFSNKMAAGMGLPAGYE